MRKIKLRRPGRIIRQTSAGGLVLIRHQFAKYTPFRMIFHWLSQKRFGLSILSLWLILVFRAVLGSSSFYQLAKDWDTDQARGILVNYRKSITHRLLARNIHRFSPQITRKVVIGTAKAMFTRGLLSAKKVAIDSTQILVTGSKYPKTGTVKKNGKYYTGYKLSIAFDVIAKVPLAYIVTPLTKHDSQLLIPLLKFVQKVYNSPIKEVILDRGYYGNEYFTFLKEQGFDFFIPAKKYSAYKKKLEQLDFKSFKYYKKRKVFYKDENLWLSKYGVIRCIFVVSKEYKEWMPEEGEKERVWAIYTNNCGKSPQRIIETYRDRWQIEVFFKEIKQNLGLKKLPGRDYRIVQMHIGSVLLAYLCLISLVLEEATTEEQRAIAIKTWKNMFIKLVLTIHLKGNYIFLEFQEKWISLSKNIESFLNGGIFM